MVLKVLCVPMGFSYFLSKGRRDKRSFIFCHRRWIKLKKVDYIIFRFSSYLCFIHTPKAFVKISRIKKSTDSTLQESFSRLFDLPKPAFLTQVNNKIFGMDTIDQTRVFTQKPYYREKRQFEFRDREGNRAH